MKRTTAARKLVNALRAISKQKQALYYSAVEQEVWRALMDAEKILDRALFALLKEV